MGDWIGRINGIINEFVWGVPMMLLIVGTGLYFTLGTNFLQLRRFGYAMGHTVGRCLKERRAKPGAVSPAQALTTALAATVGTGNIAGVCGAIAIGGPGAVFWMWVCAFLGMCTKFAEITLSIAYRQRNRAGDWVGGPMYYMKNGLERQWQWLGTAFALFGAIAAFGIGNMTQVNTIATAAATVAGQFTELSPFQTDLLRLGVGIVTAAMGAAVYIGGVKRIGSVAEKIVPAMAIAYIAATGWVIVSHGHQILPVLSSIFQGAFHPEAVMGGAAGTGLARTIQSGVGRGLFSNEAGLGSAPIAHAAADTKSPVEQGLFGIFEVFADTIVICTLTALTILCSGVEIPYGQSGVGADLAIGAFATSFGGGAVSVVAAGLILFALSTTLSWGLYGCRCAEFLLGHWVLRPYQVLFCAFMVAGATMRMDLAWSVADTLNGLMALPNLTALLLLSPVVFRMTEAYFTHPQKKKGRPQKRASRGKLNWKERSC